MSAQPSFPTGGPAFEPRFGFIVALIAIVTLPRLVMIAWGDAHVGGDSFVYKTVALNILENFCVSMSNPTTGVCAPHWGGNQLPGYPAFIAAVWLVAGKSIAAVLVAQTLVFAIAAVRLLVALAALGLSHRSVLFGACLLGVSPSLIGFSRGLLTETLATAAAIWLLGELVSSWRAGSLRAVPIALTFCAGLFLRYDFVLTAVPIAVAGFWLHRPAQAIRRGVLIALIVALPLGLWTLRSVGQNLPSAPPFGLTPQGHLLPVGMLSWIGTWLDDQYDLEPTVWQLVHFDHAEFQPPVEAYVSEAEREQVTALINKLTRNHQGAPPPASIDNEFTALAAARIENHLFDYYVLLPMRRLAHMWLSPFPGMGWPSEVTGRARERIKSALSDDDWAAVTAEAIDSTGTVLAKIVVSLHRYLLIGIAFAGLIIVWRQRGWIRFAAALVLSFAITRSLFFSVTLLVETRYLVPALAWLDILALIILASTISRRTSHPR